MRKTTKSGETNEQKQNKQKQNWRDSPCPRRGRLSIVKMSVLPIVIYRFNASLMKITARYLVEKLILKFTRRSKDLE